MTASTHDEDEQSVRLGLAESRPASVSDEQEHGLPTQPRSANNAPSPWRQPFLQWRLVVLIVVIEVFIVSGLVSGLVVGYMTVVGQRRASVSASVSSCEWPTVDAAKDQSPLIKVIQWMLISHKRPGMNQLYTLGDTGVDGLAGPATQQAVKDFQQDNHLNPTGVVDTFTWEKLILPSKEGDYGKQVKALQVMLNTYSSLPTLSADRDYGPITERVVEKFQEMVGLPKTGEADLNTWCKLVGGQLK